MIDVALEFLRDMVDQFLRKQLTAGESMAILNSLIDTNGSIPPSNQNKIILTLINIRKESVFNLPVGSPRPETYRASLLVTANFDNYSEGLKYLTAALQFFQQNPLFAQPAFPKFPPGMQEIKLTMENISYQELHLLWTAMGTRYQPSAIYQLTLI